MNFIYAFTIAFVLCWITIPILLTFLKTINFCTTVLEGRAKVYLLFGRVLGVVSEPGLHFLWLRIGPQAALVRFFGGVHEIDIRLDQEYLRSNPVNTEEGTPMGVGVWYEMRVKDPVDYLFQNLDPRGSLRANVANASVRCLSNLPLQEMLESRHAMSHTVRQEVAPKAEEWGYQFGSVYVRKVHFRDNAMIRQIEQKVVNRLRQVTSAIRQVGKNQVDIITSSAERRAAIEFAKALSVRPQMVAQTLREIGQDADVLDAIFTTLEVDRLAKSNADITLVPDQADPTLTSLLASGVELKPAHASPVKPPAPPSQS
ncbi:MAG TPA: SPFH domain-containing protein [Chthoniobacterales bacterium]|jgi:regulator of protease activity HflC (stomatin/prohibitin superfamily)|nr:SPFH domain-containing protein [Chthoniobacterales bacterium]